MGHTPLHTTHNNTHGHLLSSPQHTSRSQMDKDDDGGRPPPPPLTLRALLEDAPPLPGRAEQPPPPGSHEPVILLCCGRAFLSQRALTQHRATDCVEGNDDDVDKDGDQGEFFGREETPGMDDATRNALKERNLLIQRLKEKEESTSTLFRMDRAPRVQRNVDLIRRLNDNADDTDSDDIGSPPASPSQVKSKTTSKPTSNASSPVIAQPQRQYPCPYCRASYARYDFLTSHMSVWHANQPHLPLPTSTHNDTNDVNVNLEDEPGVDAFDSDGDNGSEGSDEFPCPVKGCTFKSSLKVIGSLANHMDVAHKSKGQFRCKLCSSSFHFKTLLKKHEVKVHGKSPSPTTSPPTTSQAAAQRKRRRYPKKLHKCPKCDYYAATDHIKRHMRTAHSKDGVFSCSQCTCVFESKRQLSIHASAHARKEKLAEALREQNVTLGRSEEEEAEQLSCEQPRCAYKTQWTHMMEHHVNTAHVEGGLPCEFCSCTFSDDLPRLMHVASAHPREDEAKRSAIPIRWNVRKTGIAVNGIKQPPSRPVVRSTIFNRMRGGKVHSCPRCPYTSTNSVNFKFHTQVCARRHAQEPPPQETTALPRARGGKKPRKRAYTSCPMCGSRHEGLRHLAVHVERCHVEGGVTCPNCPCAFKSAASMALHNNSVHLRKKNVTRRPPPANGNAASPHAIPRGRLTSPVCAICGFKTASKDVRAGLADHRRTSHVAGGLPCPSCPCAFAHRRSLKRHAFLTHNDKRKRPAPRRKSPPGAPMFVCRHCPYSTTMALSFRRHVERSHVEGGFPCPHCPTHFQSERSCNGHILRVHAGAATPPTPKAGQCPHCAKELPTASSLAAHINSAHKATPTQEEEPKESPRKVRLGGGVLRCGRAGCAFLTLLPASLAKHQAACEATPTPQETPPTRMEATPTEEEELSCAHCQQTFGAQKDLDSHLQKAHVAGGFACRWCSRSYKTNVILAVHISKVHGQRGVSRKALTKYARSRGRQLQPTTTATSTSIPGPSSSFRIRCARCPMRFTSSWEYSVHSKRGHVEGGVKCPLCPCAFQSRKGQENHLALVHRQTRRASLKIYACPKCTWKTTHSKTTFDAHMKAAHVQGGLQCGECPCTYRSVGTLAQHYLQRHPHKQPPTSPPKKAAPPAPASSPPQGAAPVEEEEEPRRKVGGAKKRSAEGFCEVCQEEFHRAVFLTRHQKSAHVEGGARCPCCPRAYKSPSGLAFHMRVKHPGDAASPGGKRQAEEKEKFQCVLCSPLVWFPSFDAVSAHLLLLHANAPSSPPRDPSPTEEEEEEEPEGRRSSSRLLGKVKPNMFREDGDEEDEDDEDEEEEEQPKRILRRRETKEVDVEGTSPPDAKSEEKKLTSRTKELKCEGCDYVTVKQASLRAHVKKCRVEEKQAVESREKVTLEVDCSICEWRGEDVDRHEETCHVKESRRLLKRRSLLSAVHECPLCSFSFSTKFAFDVHMARAKVDANVHCQRRQPPPPPTASEDAVNVNPPTDGVHEEEGPPILESVQDEEVARELEEMAESWKKDVTSTSTSQELPQTKTPVENKLLESLKAPIRKISPSQRPLRCGQCKGLYLGPAALKAHISAVHDTPAVVEEDASPESARFRCGVCPLIFRTHVELTRHAIRSDHASTSSRLSSPSRNVTPSDVEENDVTRTSIETQTEPRKRGRPRKHLLAPPLPSPRPAARGRGRPVGSTWLLNWHKKIDDNWRLAEASSKASTQWTFDKTTDDPNSDDDEMRSVSSSSVTSEESVDVTQPPTKKQTLTSQMQSDVDVDVIDQPTKTPIQNKRKLSFSSSTATSAARRMSATSSSSSRPTSTNQSSNVSTSASGRPLRKSAETAASFISRIVADEQTVDSVEPPQETLTTSTSTGNANSPVNVVDSTSAHDEVVEITPSDEVVVQEPDSTTPAPPPNRRGDWLKEFMRVMCSRCSASFDSSFLLAKHFHVCAATCDSFTCVLCDTPRSHATLQRLKEHIWRSHKPPSFVDTAQSVYSCALCKQELSDRKSFIFHSSVPHLFRCRKCAFTCHTRHDMDAHKTSGAHGKPKKPPPPPRHPTTSTSSVTTALRRTFTCKCGANFSRAPDLDAHAINCVTPPNDLYAQWKQRQRQQNKRQVEDTSADDVATGPDVPVDVDPPQDVNSEEKKTEEESESLVCEHCAYVSADIHEAREHADQVASNESTICDLCGMAAASKCDLVLHARGGCAGGDVEVDKPADVSTESAEGPSQCVQPISLNADQLLMSLEDLGEEPLILFDVAEVAAASANQSP